MPVFSPVLPFIYFVFYIYSIQDTREILNPHELLEEEGREGEVRFWIGKDYANFIYKDFVDLDQPFTGKLIGMKYW